VNPGLRQAMAYVPLILVLPVLWVSSEGQVAFPPVLWVSVAAIAGFSLWTAFGEGQASWLDVVIAGLLGVAATHRLLWPGIPLGNDTFHHLWGAYGFYRAILDGNFLPRWIHHLGLGMPLLLFYPPLPYYLTLPFLMLSVPVYDAFKFGLVFSAVLSGISMFWVARRWTGDRSSALVAAGAYCFAPYHLLNSNYRAAMAEAAAMAVLPVFFYAASRAIEEPSRQRMAVAAVWTGVLALTHLLSLSMAVTGMTIWVLSQQHWKMDRPLGKRLAVLALVGLWGVGLAGYYTLPMAVEGRYTTIDELVKGGKHPKYYWRGLTPGELLKRQRWGGLYGSKPEGSEDKQKRVPLYFGLSLLALLPLARHPRTPRGLLAMTLGSLALTLYPLDRALAYFPPMTILQFPWRFLSIATFGACALAGFATLRILESAQGRWFKWMTPGAVFALLVLDAFPFAGAPAWRPPYEGIYLMSEEGVVPDRLPLRVDLLPFPPSDPRIDLSLLRGVFQAYFTKDARKAYYHATAEERLAILERAAVGVTFRSGRAEVLQPTPYAEFTPFGGDPVRGLEFTRGGERIIVKLPGEAGTLVVKEQWFPGWEGQIGPTPVEVGKTEDGLMAFRLKMVDAGELTLHFSRTRWDRLAGVLISGACLIGLWWPRMRWRGSSGQP